MVEEQNMNSPFTREPINETTRRYLVNIGGEGRLDGGQSLRPRKDDGFPLRGDTSFPLWERILAWCRYANWFGPDYHKGRYAGHYYMDGHLQSRVCLHNPREGFEFAPVTEQELLHVEEAFGFVHPPLLRDLYLHIANGGFGPGTGLIGIPGGFCYWLWRDLRYDRLMKEHLLEKCTPIHGEGFCERTWPELFAPIPFDLEAYERSHHQPNRVSLVRGEWPTCFLNISESEGDGSYYVHAKTGHVYLVDNSFDKAPLRDGQEVVYELHRQADSLEEWFERWLNGELKDLFFHENDI
ncbi:SMI1/KNR4 family protein [Ktedonospora formicarum]|uniref:Knr4/Smi1-like domain-containing protein n=1 Tax=Ktedonospora formicarum TaxID=2778364 RepID=A0A8J3MWA4_9CHLR|nr:SMI1/KNR4 family protein [Ktedonospora formicarum]GHO48463.1 hypothetical protein KSX_66260 [Ktedonospora formicarum]